MKKGKRLLLLTAVLAVFIAGTLILKGVNDAKKAADRKPNEDKTVVLALDKDKVQEISYTYQGETLHFKKAGDHWQYADDASFPLKESMVTSMADAFTSLTATRKVADTLDQASDYGLTEPPLTVTATLADGTKNTLYFGDKNSVTSDTYLYLDGSQTVYTVASSVAEKFHTKLYGLITDEAFPTIDATAIGRLTYTSPDKNLALTYLPKGSEACYTNLFTWFNQGADGSVAPLDGDKISTYLGNVAGIAATGTVDYDATDAELAAYGLDVPSAVITADYTVSHQESVPKATATAAPSASPTASPEAAAPTPDVTAAASSATPDGIAAATATPSPAPETETITVSEPKQITISLGKQAEDGSFYMRQSDSKRVFLIGADTYAKLMDLTLESLTPKQFCLVPIDTVDNLTVSMNAQEKTFTLERTQTTDKDGKTITETKYMLGGTEVGESAFKDFYTALISLQKESSAKNAVTGKPYMTVTFHRNVANPNFKEMTLTIYPYDSSFYAASFNGETGMLVNKRDVEALVSAFQALGG